jgi:hypothetical protein
MIDVARAVLSAGAVDGPALVDLEQIASVEIVNRFGADLAAGVPDDELALPDRD